MKQSEKKKAKAKRVVAVSWTHKEKDRVFFDGDKILSKEPTFKKGNTVLTTNMPTYQAKKYMDKGVNILCAHVMAVKDHRLKMGIVKSTHYKNPGRMMDAQVIYHLYQVHPKLFIPWTAIEMNLFFRNFIQAQKVREAAQLRAWALKGKDVSTAFIESLKVAEKEAVKAMEKLGKGDIIYEYLTNIRQVGPRTGGGLRGLVDATKFPTASKLRRYAGLSVIDNKIQRPRSGETGGYDRELKALLLKRIGDSIIKSSGAEEGKIPNPSEYFIDYTVVKEDLMNKKPKDIPIENKDEIIGDLLAEDVGGFLEGQHVYKEKVYPKILKELIKKKRKTVKIRLSKGHIHNRAIRKMMQFFLEDLWVISRQLDGFSTVQPYALTIEGHIHYRIPRYIPEILKPFDPVRGWGWIFKTGKRPWSEASEYVKHKCGKK